MEKIISKNNAHIVEAAKLKQLKHRKASGKFLIEGCKVLDMAMYSEYVVDSIFIDEDKECHFDEIIRKAESNNINTYSITQQVSTKISSGKNPQGIFAVVNIKEQKASDIKGDLVIALENLSDPGNMGTIIRTADAIGVKCILLSKDCVDIYNEKVIRASMGSVLNVNTVVLKEFAEEVSELKGKGYHIACGHLKGDDFFARKRQDKNIVIIGNEAKGISDKVVGICDSLWKLPMVGNAESLNAAVASGIMMYDIIKKNN